ncbi:MAG: C2H2-type zinc finger protein [Nitrososphaerales archaeon]
MPSYCSLCGESFKDEEELNKHIKKKHKDRIKLAKFEHPIANKSESLPYQ